MQQIYSSKGQFLTLLLIFISLSSKAQSNYSVVQIPFLQYTGVLPISFTGDDTISSIIALPFNFDFYGNTYNQIVVGTNGHLGFNTNTAGTFDPYSFSTTIPNTTFPIKNAVLGCYHDLDNSNAQGTVKYGQYGTAPNRKFVVIFSNQSHYLCTAVKSSFQMILNETSNVIDVQLINKGVCNTWQSGRAVTGLINATGAGAITPPNRNTSAWTTSNEGWRFYRPGYYTNYQFIKCDANADGIETFNLQVAINDLTSTMGNAISFYQTLADANSQINAIPLNYTNSTSYTQIVYAVGGGQIKTVTLKTLDCAVDYDTDGVSTNLEDPNLDTNLANDDTDFDGLYNYLDNDDDGDLVLTNVEYVFSRSSVSAIIDTDNDGKPNYIDSDDDGDGILTFNEDANNDGNPANDDTNSNGTPDYLENLALDTNINEFEHKILLYPNPTSNILNINNLTTETISKIEIFTVNGLLIKHIKPTESIESVDVSAFQSGIYFVKIVVDNQVINYKFIKN